LREKIKWAIYEISSRSEPSSCSPRRVPAKAAPSAAATSFNPPSMSYAYALLIVIYACFLTGVRAIFRGAAGSEPNRKQGLVGLMLVVLATTLALPMLQQFFNGYLYAMGKPVSIDQDNRWTLAISAVSSLAAMLYFAYDLRALARTKSPGFFKIGRDAVCILCCGFMIFAIGDHFVFFKNRENSGTLDIQSMRMFDPEFKGVECAAGTVIVADYTEHPVRYRCPRTLVWGSMVTPTPFVPWPSYEEGTSETLGRAVQAMFDKSLKSEDKQDETNK